MSVSIKGMMSKERLLEIIRDFILYMDGKDEKIKILAQYHQMFAVKKALEKTKEAKVNEGKIREVWHT